jgi:hypothetical protein
MPAKSNQTTKPTAHLFFAIRWVRLFKEKEGNTACFCSLIIKAILRDMVLGPLTSEFYDLTERNPVFIDLLGRINDEDPELSMLWNLTADGFDCEFWSTRRAICIKFLQHSKTGDITEKEWLVYNETNKLASGFYDLLPYESAKLISGMLNDLEAFDYTGLFMELYTEKRDGGDE